MQTPLLSVALWNNNEKHLVPAKAGLNSGVVLFSSGLNNEIFLYSVLELLKWAQ